MQMQGGGSDFFMQAFSVLVRLKRRFGERTQASKLRSKIPVSYYDTVCL